jgi:hypothetical protein
MKPKILIPLLTVVALALPAAAMAGLLVPTKTGNMFASKTQSGTCVAKKVLTTAVLRCSGSGAVTVRYPFKLQAGCQPNVTPSVDWMGDAPTYGAKQTASNAFVLWVRTAGQSRVTISTVSLQYYC